ncbi:unnamed protein product [Didymodactylos carnosus]|uniref:Reverse transcriptase domain-containing protein n=1 Tax=Didymodactylos carnosus TaxID=1234261 RepID=A0A814CNV1_9BILA|nr:unnamed protein product [Didymodactylos carnosus]CAF3719247.1 unnamed protein product [Didymodactylos carnosus]
MIKLLPPTYIEGLNSCFNTWLRERRYPDGWKIAKFVILNKLKAGTPACDQTRPISLLATHSKIFEEVMLERVKNWAEANHIIPDEQSDFRSNCLLPTRVLSIFQEVNFAANIPTLAIFVDYQKAYDNVWHMALIVKLFRLGIPLGLLKIVHSWLSDRKAYVILGDMRSKAFYLYIGLPQASSLSPVSIHCFS